MVSDIFPTDCWEECEIIVSYKFMQKLPLIPFWVHQNYAPMLLQLNYGSLFDVGYHSLAKIRVAEVVDREIQGIQRHW
jgi:hypothetical protein